MPLGSLSRRTDVVNRIKTLFNTKHFVRPNEKEPEDHAGHLYALWSMGNHHALNKTLRADGILNEFWQTLEHLSPQLNEHFIAPNLGEWDGFPANLVRSLNLLPGDLLVIKQHQNTLWDWQHAGMVRDEVSAYSAMYTESVLIQSLDYYMHYATRLRVLRVLANHADPTLGRKACEVADSRLGNVYGISDKWYACHHDDAPMYCSLLPWYSWMKATGINLDRSSPDYEEILDEKRRLWHLSKIPHAIVFPGNLAESSENDPEHHFVCKTEVALDICRPGYEESTGA